MALGARSEEHELEEALQELREAQGLEGAPRFRAEEGQESAPSSISTLSASASVALYSRPLEEANATARPSPPQSPPQAQPLPQAMPAPLGNQSPANHSCSQGDEAPGDTTVSLQDVLRRKKIQLVAFLLHKYRSKEPTTKAEMLELVAQDHEDHFPDILSRATWCLQLTFSIDIKEVDPNSHSYVLVPTLGLTWDGVTEEQHLPKIGLLALLLGVIVLWGGQAPEEEVWGVLSVVGVCPGREHFIYGEPRDLITRVWVQEQYLEYQQVPDSDPACCELLWGPRAHAEASKVQVLLFLLRLFSRAAGSFLSPSKEARSNEEQGS
ncbi:melanoma-associated antigen 11-like [Manis pentadactyla]|uniref:melanoma-associated antigen 11-like n=1 Tax=Manis pentadactyla TaxID=143292 RepID=UPI00255CEFA9|nr:melanoma-associated antigen 11-like [Manis pentadactyla]